MKFTYFYSPSYEFYNVHLKENLGDLFDVKGIIIDEIKPGTDKSKHHFDKLTIKIELIIKEIEENIGNFIIFSDATIFVNNKNRDKLPEYFKKYEENDLTFINESSGKYYNIGLILIKCDEKTLNFFKNVLETMKTNEKYTHDQTAINYLLKNSGLKYGFFDEKIFSGAFIKDYKDSFYIYKSFIDNVSKTNNFNQRIQNFYDNGLIDKETYEKYIQPENIEKFSNYSNNNIKYEFFIFVTLILIFCFILYFLSNKH